MKKKTDRIYIVCMYLWYIHIYIYRNVFIQFDINKLLFTLNIPHPEDREYQFHPAPPKEILCQTTKLKQRRPNVCIVLTDIYANIGFITGQLKLMTYLNLLMTMSARLPFNRAVVYLPRRLTNPHVFGVSHRPHVERAGVLCVQITSAKRENKLQSQ